MGSFSRMAQLHEGNGEYYAVVVRLCATVRIDILNVCNTIHETDTMSDIVNCLGCILYTQSDIGLNVMKNSNRKELIATECLLIIHCN
jgi:hypothetical protein